jgi:hypothetical protein
MAWKRALFYGGAVVVLAACSNATAPDGMNRKGAQAAAKTSPTPTTTTTTTTSTTSSETTLGPTCNGYVVYIGDSTAVCGDQ